MRTKCYCKACNAAILWMFTESGKMTPVNYDAKFDQTEKFDSKTMTSHFATCTEPDKFRKKKEKSNESKTTNP